MKETIRRAIAHKVAAKINGVKSGSIYSYFSGRHSHMSNSYDYDAGAHISDSNTGFYHYGESAHVSLSVNGNRFSGYDYSSSSHFSGQISGHSISLYDYGDGGHFNYSV